MLSFKIEDESRHRFLFFIPRAFLEEWLSASVALNLQHAFACLIPDETCSFSATFPRLFIPGGATCTFNFAIPATNQITSQGHSFAQRLQRCSVGTPGMSGESKQQSKNRVLCDNCNFHHRTHALCVERSGKEPARTFEFGRWWSEVTSRISPQHPHHSACDGLRISIPKETFVLSPAAVDIATNYEARESRECPTHVDVK